MMRDDMAAARRTWLRAAWDDTKEYARRDSSDFLLDTNHERQSLNFHCLRHTCGAWLSMTGAHPKLVQHVMRHSSITLTMDTYGHLFPGQDVDAVARMKRMFTVQAPSQDSTGTVGSAPGSSEKGQRICQHSGCCSARSSATGCKMRTPPKAQKKTPETPEIASPSDEVRLNSQIAEEGLEPPTRGL